MIFRTAARRTARTLTTVIRTLTLTSRSNANDCAVIILAASGNEAIYEYLQQLLGLFIAPEMLTLVGCHRACTTCSCF
jgi:hypothetical protein